MTAHDCPAKEQLAAFALGKVGDDEAEPIAQHLEACPLCAETIDCLSDATDLVIARVKRPAEPGRFESDSGCRQAIDRVKQYGHDPSFSTLSGVAAGTATPAFPATGSTDRATGSGPFPFLAPPQSADEMGRLGAYRILKVLGKGGMGVVFQAEDPRLGRLCALKVMLPEVADRPGMKERFLREARAAAQIEHDHIIPVFQVDEERGVPYIAMPFLKGMSLEDWIRRKLKEGPGAIKVAEILKLGRQIARGLAAAHERGMIHRDIKPANVWLDASAGGRVKILDFGLARLETADQQHLTQSGAVMGTPSYMAPEQAKGEQVDGRADLFSLGVILHRLCTGELPFKGKDTISTLLALATHTPPAPHTVNPAIPQPLSDLVVKLLAKEPADRLASAKDAVAILQGLEKSLAGPDPASAATPSMSAGLMPPEPSTERFPIITVSKAAPRGASPARVPRSAKRGTPPLRRLVIAAGGVGIALLVAGILIFWQTPNGTVRIEIDDATMTAEIDKNGVILKRGDDKPIELKPGPHGIRIKRGDFEFETNKFVLTKGEDVVLKVERQEGQVTIMNGRTVVDQGSLSAAGALRETPLAAAPVPAAPYALQFDGDDHVEVDGIGWGKLENYTFEAFASLDQFPKDVGFIVNRYKYGSLAVNTDGRWMLSFKYKDDLPAGNLYDAAPAELKKRFHLAGVANGRQFRLFVDGKLVDEKTAEGKLKAVLDNRLSFGNGFSGTLDGIRISQVARYDAPFTPPARFEKDANTLVLYGFTEGTGSLLVDASGNGRQGKIVGAKWVRADLKSDMSDPKTETSDPKPAAPVPGDYALQSSGEGVQADTSNISLKAWDTWTVEAWVTPREPFPRGGEMVTVLMVDPVWFVFRDYNGYKWALGGPATRPVGMIIAKAKFEPGKPVHVAMSRGPQGVSLFVNGVREGTPFPAGIHGNQQSLRICPPRNPIGRDVGFNGDLDELRVSSVERYPENFTPKRRFEPDDKTLVLYHFDEGQGEVITDSSGNGRDGKLVGAKWVQVALKSEISDQGSAPPPYKNSLGMEFAMVPKGKAWLGGGGGKPGDKETEFKNDFYLGVYEVTQEEWQKVMGSNPSRFSQTGGGRDMVKQIADVELRRFPVESVSWDDAQAFLKLLNEKANDAGWHYRLPSEDEWEYACRGGPIDKPDSAYDFYFKTGTTQLLPQDANFQADKGLNRTNKAGSYLPNRLGLYDLHGNVWEWCDDKIPAENPQDPPYRAYRGGGWEDTSILHLAASRRHRDPPATRFASLGLRLARVRDQK